ncbi:MAG: DUF6714 family protein [Thermosynechococcaceae cyanobacterium]
MNEDLCKRIQDAFAGVTLGNGVGLQQAQGLDDYDDEATCNRYRDTDEKDDWSQISVEALNRCNSSLSFFDAEGMRFHLPAYLITDLQGAYHFDLIFCLTHLNDYRISQFALLSEAQRSAVRVFLLHIAKQPDSDFDRPHITLALNEYWT